VVTGDAAHSHRATAADIAGPEEQGGRASDYLLFVKGNEPARRRSPLRRDPGHGRPAPGYTELDHGHGRIIRRSIWVAAAPVGLGFPYSAQVMRIQRDGYDTAGTCISEEIVHAVTSLDPDRAGPADLARIARGQRLIESVHGLRDTAAT
jgi:hypothetical protein